MDPPVRILSEHQGGQTSNVTGMGVLESVTSPERVPASTASTPPPGAMTATQLPLAEPNIRRSVALDDATVREPAAVPGGEGDDLAGPASKGSGMDDEVGEHDRRQQQKQPLRRWRETHSGKDKRGWRGNARNHCSGRRGGRNVARQQKVGRLNEGAKHRPIHGLQVLSC